MPRLSRGCLRCKQRRVRCDEGQPSCQRCIKRDEICKGYSDEASLTFRHETDKVIERACAVQDLSSSSSRASGYLSSYPPRQKNKHNKAVDRSSISPSSEGTLLQNVDSSLLNIGEANAIKLDNRHPWLKNPSMASDPPLRQQIVENFMENYVLYPSNLTSSPGFLEHLPCMFQEVNINGRYALRWAVQAAAYANISTSQDNDMSTRIALQSYGRALSALGDSLAAKGKAPDDYDLMTVVVLDIFETLYTPDVASKGSHAQGMAQILRVKGTDMLYNPRSWSLFRLAHHRIQKQELSFNMVPIPEAQSWLDQLNEEEPSVRLQKSTTEINETCKRARLLLDLINNRALPVAAIINMIQELHSLDQVSVSWRQTSEWSFEQILVSSRPDLEAVTWGITDTVQLHSDIWMAYEWNYHRTARIIFLYRLLTCAFAALETPNIDNSEEAALNSTVAECTSTIEWLADQILSTVPQTLGDINHLGKVQAATNGPPRCRAVGGYLLLWPVKTIKAQKSETSRKQKECALRVFERIRDYTGMKAILGERSSI